MTACAAGSGAPLAGVSMATAMPCVDQSPRVRVTHDGGVKDGRDREQETAEGDEGFEVSGSFGRRLTGRDEAVADDPLALTGQYEDGTNS